MSTLDLDLKPIDRIVQDTGRTADAVVPILHAIQQHYRYLPEPALQRVCELTEITPAAITGVSTFYDAFRHRPVGRNLVSICHGTACHVKGSSLIHDAVEQHLGLAPGQDTTDDGNFTVMPVACVGCCTLAPVVRIDEANHGHLRAADVPGMLRDSLNAAASSPDRLHSVVSPSASAQGEIRIGLDSSCLAQGSGQVFDELNRVVEQYGAAAKVKGVGGIGMCYQSPLVEIVQPSGDSTYYANAEPPHAREIVLRHFQPVGVLNKLKHQFSRVVDRLYSAADDPTEPSPPLNMGEGPVRAYLKPQKLIATEYCGELNPLDIDEYRRHEGFAGLEKSLQMSPEQIVEEVRSAGLRGRGGAGFPSHAKWDIVRRTEASQKYIICNGDEGDPGAFMDRMILESFPYRVIEGMTIAARAIGASEGFLYIRAEYPDAVRRITEAIRRCEERGLLGDQVSGSDFRLRLSVKQGGGAFICGEETALIRSIEGHRGTPRLRPPYPAECGLWEKPTLINNVETFALVPWIIRHGADAFASLGTEKSKGTKVFALAGRIERGGLIEVPMGVTIREIVEEIGGGVGPGRRFKAVQIGGPSGGCIPAELADTPVDYEALAELGAIMGSGGLVVLDDSDCMVDIARYFLRFTREQSCGKCTFCRVGTKRMLDILDRICTGRGRAGDIKKLEQLAAQVGGGSLCGLGKTAPNPVLSTLQYFREEFEAHLDGRCPAGKCKDLIHYQVTNKCIGCTLCAQHCPVEAIPFTPYEIHTIDDERCTRCDACRDACPESAIKITSSGN